MTNHEIEAVLAAWTPYIDSIDNWKALVDGVTPKETNCGPVYEIPNPIDRPNESFAIADMRDIEHADPHYHTNGETEIYLVLSGVGKVVVGGVEAQLAPGAVSITPPDTAHYAIPIDNLVLAVINTPPFNFDNVVPVTETDASVGFDSEQFTRLTQGLASR